MNTLTKESFVPKKFEGELKSKSVERSFIKTVMHNTKSNPLAFICLILLILIITASLLADFYPYDPNQIDVMNQLQGPTAEHILGTDEMGRDYLARALHGGQVSLYVGFFSMVISAIVGLIIGLIAGYNGGWIDVVLMRFIDLFMSIPSIIIIVVLNIFITPNVNTLTIMIGMFSWTGIARIVRAQTMSLKEREYVAAAQSLGSSPLKITYKHVMPNMIPELIVASTITMARAIIQESTLSYLGFGIRLPQASWGTMLQGAQTFALDRPMLSLIPGMLILFVVLSLNVLGDVLRKSTD